MSPKSSVSLVWSKFVGCVKNARIVSLTEDAEEGKGGFPLLSQLYSFPKVIRCSLQEK